MKRFLSMEASEMLDLSKEELLNSIKASEGRVVVSENVVVKEPVVDGITSSEIARAFGADLLLLNVFDMNNPLVKGLESTDPVKDLRQLTGRPVGVNLEPVDLNAPLLEQRKDIPMGRIATEESLKKAEELGFDYICLTGNPGTGVSTKKIAETIHLAKKHFSGIIIAGKMHGAGVDEQILDSENIDLLLEAGADIILLPAVGTVPGITMENLTKAIEYIHRKSRLVMTTIGTSQESSPKEIIRRIALDNKICGADLQHIGDAGYGGLGNYMNIFEMSRTIRGDRHTIKMMASSIRR